MKGFYWQLKYPKYPGFWLQVRDIHGSPGIQNIQTQVRSLVIHRHRLVVSPVRSTYGGYYGLVGVPPPRPRPRPPRPRPRPPRPQTLHRSHDNLKNPYRIASIFYM